MSFHLAQLNLGENQSTHNLNNWPASQGRRAEYFTARAITGGTTNMGELARPIVPTEHLVSERYPVFVRNNTDYSTNTLYPQTNNGYVGNCSSFVNSTNQYTASEASYSSKSSANYFNRSYVKANNDYGTNRGFSANKSDYASNGSFNTPNGEQATTNGSFTRSDYSSSRNYSRFYNEYATNPSYAGNSNGYTSDKAANGYSGAAGYSQSSNNDVQSEAAPAFPRNNNAYQTSGDLGRNNFDYPKPAASLPSFSPNSNDEGFSYYSKNTGLSSPFGTYTLLGNGPSSTYESQSAKPNAKKPTSQGGNQSNKSGVYASHRLYGAPVVHEDEDLDTTDTLSPAESETSGVSSFSGLSSHCSYYTRPDDSFMKLRFKNEKPVVLHENRNILDLGSNVKPFGGFFSSTPLPEASKSSKNKSHYDRNEEVTSSSPDLSAAEPCQKCGYVMVHK